MRDAPVCHHVSTVNTVKTLIELACPLQGCLALAEALMNVMPFLVMDESGQHVRETGLQCIQTIVDLQVRSLILFFATLPRYSTPKIGEKIWLACSPIFFFFMA